MPQCSGQIRQADGSVERCPNIIPSVRPGQFAQLRCLECRTDPIQPRNIMLVQDLATPAPTPLRGGRLPPLSGFRPGSLGDSSIALAIPILDAMYRLQKLTPEQAMVKSMDNCAICLEGLYNDAKNYYLPCEHIVHKHCLDSYSRAITTEQLSRYGRSGLNQDAPRCPLCRRPFRLLRHLRIS